MSDQWGQQPQNPYESDHRNGSYGPNGPYGDQSQAGSQPPQQQPQNPYGVPPTQPMPDPYAGQPGQFGQPIYPGQGGYPGQQPQPQPQQNPYDPYGQQQPGYGTGSGSGPGSGYPYPPQQAGYGYPQSQSHFQPQPQFPPQFQPQPVYQPQPQFPLSAGNKKNQNMIISGAVVLVLVVAGVVFIGLNRSGSGGGASAAGAPQTQSCAAWKAEQTAMNNQNPNTEADMISELSQDLPAMKAIVQGAGSGSFKADMSKVTADFTELQTYLQANPNLDTSSSTPPAAFVTIDESITSDLTTLDSLCGLPNPATSGGSGI